MPVLHPGAPFRLELSKRPAQYSRGQVPSLGVGIRACEPDSPSDIRLGSQAVFPILATQFARFQLSACSRQAPAGTQPFSKESQSIRPFRCTYFSKALRYAGNNRISLSRSHHPTSRCLSFLSASWCEGRPSEFESDNRPAYSKGFERQLLVS